MKIKMKHPSIEITIVQEKKNMYRNYQYSYQQAQRSKQTTIFKQPLLKQYTKHKKKPCDRNGIQLRC